MKHLPSITGRTMTEIAMSADLLKSCWNTMLRFKAAAMMNSVGSWSYTVAIITEVTSPTCTETFVWLVGWVVCGPGELGFLTIKCGASLLITTMGRHTNQDHSDYLSTLKSRTTYSGSRGCPWTYCPSTSGLKADPGLEAVTNDVMLARFSGRALMSRPIVLALT